jgi:hypothetical protein
VRTRIVKYTALAVLVAASIGWAFAWDWQNYQRYNPTAIVDVPRDAEESIDGAVFSLADLKVIEGDSDEGRRYAVAAGTDLVIADLRVSPREPRTADEIGRCEVRYHAPSPDGEREWRPALSNATTYPPQADENVFGCTVVADDEFAAGEPYVWRNFFVVPAGGAVDGYLQVTVLGELPRALHLH